MIDPPGHLEEEKPDSPHGLVGDWCWLGKECIWVLVLLLGLQMAKIYGSRWLVDVGLVLIALVWFQQVRSSCSWDRRLRKMTEVGRLRHAILVTALTLALFIGLGVLASNLLAGLEMADARHWLERNWMMDLWPFEDSAVK